MAELPYLPPEPSRPQGSRWAIAAAAYGSDPDPAAVAWLEWDKAYAEAARIVAREFRKVETAERKAREYTDLAQEYRAEAERLRDELAAIRAGDQESKEAAAITVRRRPAPAMTRKEAEVNRELTRVLGWDPHKVRAERGRSFTGKQISQIQQAAATIRRSKGSGWGRNLLPL